jgi:hypothetical protein
MKSQVFMNKIFMRCVEQGPPENQTAFYLRESLENIITNTDPFQPFPDAQSFTSVGLAGAFWDWLEDPLINTVFPDDASLGLGSNMVLGALRLRQLRVKSTDCDVPDRFSRLVEEWDENQRCYPDYSVETESKRHTQAEYVWNSASSLRGGPIRGVSGIYYPGNGFVVE